MEPRTFSFTCKVFEKDLIPDAADFRFENPVEIFSGEHRVGFGMVYATEDNSLMAECYIAWECPERLDIENQMPIWVLPRITVQRRYPYDRSSPSVVTVRHLEFHTSSDASLPKVWEGYTP